MLKKYIDISLGFGEKFWDANWRDASIEEAVRFCRIDPLSTIFDKYLPREGKILEAGCGLGQYVIYYRSKGYDIEGIDFSKETIEKILKFDKILPVQIADVTNLPHKDNFFKAYYSGGVVEHFEEGPDSALKEAYRVLAPEGVLIITVPYLNPFRRFNSLWTSILRDSVQVDHDGRKVKYLSAKEPEKENSPFSEYVFHEYYYKKDEFVSFLQKNGFRVIYVQGTLVSWGLKDIALLRKFFTNFKKNKKANRKKCQSCSFKKKYLFSSGLKAYLKKLIINEQADSAIEQAMLYFLQKIFSNLILFVCRVEKNGH